jgi:phenylalanyl-tRNA synthetase beta chain
MREFVDLPANESAAAVAARLAACGFEVAEVEEGAEPVIDFEVTANRPDCLSIRGLAREAAVAHGVPFSAGGRTASTQSNQSIRSNPSNQTNLTVTIDSPDLCARYAAQVARVRIGPSPAWMQQRLIAAGVRPINNVVDVTNYVMIERGHPMHAFDLGKLGGERIVVRRAKPGETLRTLDGVDRTLDSDMLVIADAERAAAVAGVMGGADSEVSDRTTTIALESAWFLPKSVRVTSRRLGLKSEASARFERGADIDAPLDAMARAIGLLEQIGAGEGLGPAVDCYPALAVPRSVALRASRIAHLLGAAVPAADIERILTGLGFGVSSSDPADLTNRSWSVSVPSWRVDVAREADLIEEVGRHFGYDRLPTTFPVLRDVAPAPDARIAREERARRVLLACGFNEAVSFTFIDRRAAEPFAPEHSIVPLSNPLSEKFAVMRPSLLPGLLDALAHNRRHGRTDARLFEIGSVVTADGERRRVALAWIGRALPEHWSETPRDADFFDVRGAVEQLCRAFEIAPRFEAIADGFLASGRAARVFADRAGTPLGSVGQLLPAIVDARDVPGRGEVYVAELGLDALGAGVGPDVHVEPLPRFPSIVRDLSILVSERLPAADVRGTIRSAAPATLVDAREFDRYHGRGIPEGRVSLSFHLTFRSTDRTLTDAEVDEAMEAIVRALSAAHAAERR